MDRRWEAEVSVAAQRGDGSLAPVAGDVPVHFTASQGRLSSEDITLSAGQFSNFGDPILLTANRAGHDVVDAFSSLGAGGPVGVDYRQPLPAGLRLSVGRPALSGTGVSTTGVQVCLLDESGAVTSSDQDVHITLTAPGQLASSVLTIRANALCSDPIAWSSGSGLATIRAEAAGLKPDSQTITFPAFPWYFVWLAALGGVVGALVISSRGLFSRRWWSHTWRSLVLGALLGAIFYLFARFGAVVLPKNWPVNIQNIPVVSGVGAFLLGLVGGLLGRKFWKVS